MADPKPIVLDYETPSQQKPTDKSRLIFLFFAIPSLIVPFLPFVEEVSPLKVMLVGLEEWPITLLAAPYFLAYPLFLLKVRKLYIGIPTTVENIIAYGLAAAWIGIACWWMLFIFDNGIGHDGFAALVLLLLISSVVFGPGWVIWMTRSPAGRRSAPEVALFIAYICNATLCLMVFSSSANIGWYLTCFVVAVFVADMVHLVAKTRRESKKCGGVTNART